MNYLKRLIFLTRAKKQHFISVDKDFYNKFKYIIILIMYLNPNYKRCEIYRKKFKRLRNFIVIGLKYNGKNVKRRTSGFAKNYIEKHRNSKCIYCDVILNYKNATADHIIPIAEGGNNTQVNLVVCCKDCNNEKGDISFKSFLRNKNKDYKKISFF